MRPFRVSTTLTVLSISLMVGVPAQAGTDLIKFSLEDLLSMEITSVAKKSQRLSEAAAAIHVITREDIRRSGMTSIPELLRLVPGLHVAQIDASKWAISSRGFNGRFTNKLLVLMDGRTLYTPLFSGVYWDVQDTLLDDIERIEVIRGPGGTVWGANAVNGVINIITQHSRETQGGLVTAIVGNQEKSTSMRYGSALEGKGWIRAFAKFTDRDDSESSDIEAYDAWDSQRAGFRADLEPSSRDSLTLQGDVYKIDAAQTIGNLDNILSFTQLTQDDADLNGFNMLLHWKHTFTESSNWEFKAYFDRAERDELSQKQRIDILDLEFQRRFRASEQHEVTWGLGYRRIEDDIDRTFTVSFDPGNRNHNVYSAFIQDEIQLRDDLRLTVGSKFEHNDFTGFEYQPSARLLWQVAEDHNLWLAASRAVRTPSRSDSDIRLNVSAFSSPFVDPDGPGPLPAGAPTLISIFGNKDFKSEELLAFEIGYRGQPRSNLSLDVAAFYNIYNNLTSSERSFSIETTPAPPHALISSTFDNQMEGEAYGLELSTNWQITQDWLLYAGYSWQKVDVRLDSGSTDTNSISEREKSSPEQQFQIRSRWNIRNNLELDLALFYTGGSESLDASGVNHVPAYTRLDARMGWQPQKNIELNLVVQNLLDDKHPEFFSTDVNANQVPRSLYGQIKLGF